MTEDITKKDNIRLFDELIRKHSSSVFINSPKPLREILVNGRNAFEQLSLDVQADILMRIISLTSVGRANVSLKEIGGPSENGRIRISGNMSNRKELTMVASSVTGLFSSTKNLLEEL